MIYAYTSFNLGDDLFIKELCERYPNLEFSLYCSRDYERNFKKITNLNIIRNDNILYKAINYIMSKLGFSYTIQSLLARQHDVVIYIGGSIFQQRKNWRRRINIFNNILKKQVPFFIIGANFGPYSDEEYYNKHRKLFSEFQGVTFRDKYSYNLFKELPNINLADDVIFQMATEESDMEIKEDYIIISVIKPSIRPYLKGLDNLYYNKIKEISEQFVENGYRVVLMSFCEREGDVEAVKSIKQLISNEYISQIDEHLYKHDIESALNAIRGSKYVVGTRFHAMILGWVYNKPVFPIAYSDKMTNVINDVNFKGNYIDFNNLEKLDAKVVLESMHTNTIDISEQRINAEKQFAQLDEFLKKK